MFCLVTGVAGFVGSTLAERLIADGHKVRGVDCFVDYYPRSIKESNLAQLKASSNFELVEGDLTALDLAPLLKGIEWIFHQAGQAGVRASWGSYFASYTGHNILATQRLLECAKESSFLKKFVYASSSSVYGDAECFPTTEKILPRPVSPYGVTKLAAEHLVSLYASQYRVPTTSLRYFTVFGPRQRPDMGFHRFIKAGLQGKEIVIYGDGEQSRDFTFISDIVEANLLAAQHGDKGEVFNIGGGTNATVNQVLNFLRSELGDLKVKYEGAQRGDARRTSADCSAAQRVLGFKPAVTLEQGLRAEIEWMRTALKSGTIS